MTGELVDTDMSGKQRAARLHKLPSTSYRVTDSLNFLKLRHKEAKDLEAVVRVPQIQKTSCSMFDFYYVLYI